MDGQAYLNQISSAVRATKPPKKGLSSIFSSIYFKIGIGAVLAVIVIAIIGGIISGGKTSLEDQIITLKLRIDRTMEVIDDYQSNVKSSSLRSSSASLYGVLSNTSNSLNSYLVDNYNYKENSSNVKKLAETADLERDALSSDLFEAKITGQLDRTFAGKMMYEISVITTSEAAIEKSIKNETMKANLASSSTSLETLYEQFNAF